MHMTHWTMKFKGWVGWVACCDDTVCNAERAQNSYKCMTIIGVVVGTSWCYVVLLVVADALTAHLEGATGPAQRILRVLVCFIRLSSGASD